MHEQEKEHLQHQDLKSVRLSAMLNALQDAFCYYDRDDRLVLFNDAMRTMYAGLEDIIQHGVTFAELVESAIERGIWSTHGRDPREYRETLLADRNGQARYEVLVEFCDDRYAIHREMPTADGGRICVCTDVTDLKRRENEALEARQEADTLLGDLRRSLDVMQMGVVILDRDLNIEIVNKAFYNIWRFSAHQLPSGSPFRALMDFNRHNGIYDVPVDEWEDYVTTRLQEISDGEVAPREFVRADGRTMIYSVTALSDGKRLVSYYDISEMKERERQAASALEKARLAETVIDSVPNPMFVKDDDLRFVMVNRAFASLFGTTPERMLGKSSRHFFATPGEVAEIEGNELEVLRSGTPFELQEDFETDNSVRSRIVRKNRVQTRSGRDYLAGSIFDVTDMKRRENESLAARAYLENVLESLPAGIIIYDNKDRFVLANQKLQAALPELQPAWYPGAPYREAITLGRQFGHFRESGDEEIDALYDADPDRWTDAYLDKRQEQYRSYIRKHPNGRWFQAIDTRSADGSFIGIRIDITDLKEREAALEEAQHRAVLADRAKSEFLANMSHEIRTPMNGVLGMAELLARSQLDDRQKTFTDIIVKSGNALLTIINDILDFSKIDAGQMVLDPAPFHLAEAIDYATWVIINGKTDGQLPKSEY